ncbi:hypothetical protein PRIPAC_79781 [Pristionchus pacificus]|uniref:Uncharacterized protein n=1 Tax=Pristionchus pacificus TaxID=54126 RepID=A0A2A6BVY5_PRIPA|nr:hypothetical protein PRIPAC_79781 [Pristionchus pacificus]|eukprot:PDM70070.1 hypothetical protein PRIPAC_49282 [Pristionchus pacificus]
MAKSRSQIVAQRMRINLIFAVCITIAKCKPSLNRSEKIRLRYGQYANITAAELSIAEEARIVGVKEEKHFEQCTTNITQLWETIEMKEDEKHP